MDIPATSDATPESALVNDMSLKQYVEKVAPNVDAAVVRAKIDFRYTDVFDKDWFGEAFFGGVMGKRPLMIEEVQKGVSPWSVKVSPMAKPRDWDDVGMQCQPDSTRSPPGG